MYKYIQELLQNIIRETSRAKVRLKKIKNGGNSFQNNRKKVSIKPEVLAPVGTERQEIERSPDFIQLKNTYDLLMKRFSNRSLQRSTPGLKSVQQIKAQDIEWEIKNLFMPNVFNDKKNTSTPSKSKKSSSTKEMTKPTETLSIGWSGQVTRSSSQPREEVALYPGNIASALLLYPEQEEDFSENSNQPQSVDRLKKRRRLRRSFTARKIKHFPDQASLRRLEKPSWDIINLGEIDSNKLKTKQACENGNFNQAPYDFCKDSNSQGAMKIYTDLNSFPERFNTSQDNTENKPFLRKQMSNPFISFTSKIKELYYEKIEKDNHSDIFGESSFKTGEKKKETTDKIKNSETFKKDIAFSNMSVGYSVATANLETAEKFKPIEEIKPQDRCDQETNVPKPLDSKVETKATTLNLSDIKSSDLPEEKISTQLRTVAALTNLSVSNNSEQTNNSTEGVISIEKNVKKDVFDSNENSFEQVMNSNSTQCDIVTQLPPSKSSRMRVESPKLMKYNEKQSNNTDPTNLLDDLNNKYKAHLSSILKRTEMLEMKVEQESLDYNKLSGLSSFKCSIKTKPNNEEETNCKNKTLSAKEAPSLNKSQKIENINSNNLLDQDRNQHTNSTVPTFNDNKKQEENINNNLTEVSNQNKVYSLEPAIKTGSCACKDTSEFSKSYSLQTKSIQENFKNVSPAPTTPTQEINPIFSDGLKSFAKEQTTNQTFNNPLESISKKKYSKHHSNYLENESCPALKDRTSSKFKKIHNNLKIQGSSGHNEKSNQLPVNYNTGQGSCKLIPSSNSNLIIKCFTRKNQDINNVPVQNMQQICEEKVLNLNSFKKEKYFNFRVKSNRIKTATLDLDKGVIRKETTNQNSTNKIKAVKKNSVSNLNEKKHTIFYDKNSHNKSIEKLVGLPQINRKRTETFVGMPVETSRSVNDLQRKLHSKYDFKPLQILSSLKKYGEEKKVAYVTNIKSLRTVSVVKKKCGSKGSTRISFDRLSSRGKKGGVNRSLLMQSRSFCTTEKKSYNMVAGYFPHQNVYRMCTNKYNISYKRSDSILCDPNSFVFSQFGFKGFSQNNKICPINHINKHKNKSKASFKTKTKLNRYKTKDKSRIIDQSQSKENNSSVVVLFSRQVQKDNENNLKPNKTNYFYPGKFKKSSKIVHNREQQKISTKLPENPFIVGKPPTDNRPKWKSKGDRIMNWNLYLGKCNNSKEPLISKLRTIIKPDSVQKILKPNKAKNYLAPSSSFEYGDRSVNDAINGRTRLIQELDSVIQREMKTNNTITSEQKETCKNYEMYNVNKTKKQGKPVEQNWNSYSNIGKYNITNDNSLKKSKMYDSSIQSIVPVIENRQHNFNKKVKHAQDVKPLSYRINNTIQNKYSDDGSWLMKNNNHLNLLVKRHSSSLRLKQCMPISNDKRAKTAESEFMINYHFDPNSLSSMKQPKVQVKSENKVTKNDQPKYKAKEEIQTSKTHNFVPSNKLKELLTINTYTSKKQKSPNKSVGNVDDIKKSAQLMPINTMMKQITDSKISLPVLNLEKFGAEKREIKQSQDKAYLKNKLSSINISNRDNKQCNKKSQRKINFLEGNHRRRSVSLTNFKKVNNVKRSKSENSFSKKVKDNPIIYKKLGNQFINLNKRYYVKPATYSIAEAKSKYTPQTNTKGKGNDGFLVTEPRKTSKQSIDRNYTQLVSQYILFKESASKLRESKKLSEKCLPVKKKPELMNKKSFIKNISMNKSHIAEHRNIPQNKNHEKAFVSEKATEEFANKPKNSFSQRRNLQKIDENCKMPKENLILTSLERERLRNKVSLINDFKNLLEKQIKQRKQFTNDDGSFALLPKWSEDNDLGMKFDLSQEVFKAKNNSCISYSLKENARPATKTPEKPKISLFGSNRKSWDLSDELESSFI